MATSSKASPVDLENEQLLIEAATEGKWETVNALLEAGTSVDAVGHNKVLFYASKNYFTPLQMACKNGHVKCAEILIGNGADVNAVDRFGVTAVHIAAEKGHFYCLQVLLTAHAECSLPTKYPKKDFYTAVPYHGGTTPLHLAAANNRIECVEELMQYGGDYNAVDELGRTSLYVAAQLGLSECILAHLRNAVGRDILSLPSSNTGDTPLHFAVSMGMTDSVVALLRSGSDPNHRNSQGFSPLHLAVIPSKDNEKDALKILKLLVLEGRNANVNLLDGADLSPLHYVRFNQKNKTSYRPDMSKFLISHGAYPSWKLLACELKSASQDIDVLKYMVRSMAVIPPVSKLKIFPYGTTRDFLDFDLELRRERIQQRRDMIQQRRDMMQQRSDMIQLRRETPSARNERRENARRARALAARQSAINHSRQSAVEQKQSYYESIASKPRTLQHFCRCSIRTALGFNVKFIEKLSIPPSMKSYLFLETGD